MRAAAALLWKLWTVEGPAAVRDRAWDRWRDVRRRASFRPLAGGLGALPSWARADVVQVLASVPAPWRGGVEAQLLDRLEGQRLLAPTALVHSDGGRLRLWLSVPGRGRVRVDLPAPTPSPLALADETFERAVAETLDALGASVLHFESAHHLPLASLAALAGGGRAVILSVHDFTLFCLRPNLLEVPAGRFCHYCTDLGRCGRCLRVDWALGGEDQARRRAAGEELLAAAACVVYPSPFLRGVHEALFAARPRRTRVLAPAVSVRAGRRPLRAPERGRRPPLVAFLGGGSIHKGSAVFREVVREWSRQGRPPVRWRVYGGLGELLGELRGLPGVKVRGYYRHGTVAPLLRRDGAELALLLSVVPESYSLALDECAIAGVPAIAFRHGALGDRLADQEDALVEPGAGSAGVVEAIARGLEAPRRGSAEGGFEVGSPAAAVRRWLELYSEVARAGGAAGGEHTSLGPPFSYPPHQGDRLRHAAGRLEWALRGIARWALGRGGPRSLRALSRRDPAPEAHAETAFAAAPIVYLPAVSWTFRFQRPQQLARALAERGHPVLYCEAFRRSRILPARLLRAQIGNVHRLQLAVPGRLDPYRQPPPAAVAFELAERIAEGLVRRPAFILAQLPFWALVALRLSRLLDVPLVYDRLDLHLGFPGIPSAIGELERRLLEGADLVLASSAVLLEGAGERAGRVDLLPNAVSVEDFTDLPRRRGGRVRLGYVGALGDWFDAASVRKLAEECPQWSFRLAGRVESEAVRALGALPNVELLGEIPYSALPAFLGRLHALLIPFLDLPLTRAVDPVKLYEALAAGLPVVSRALPALDRWQEPLVYTYRDELGREVVERALREDGPELAARRRSAVAGETWSARAAQLLGAVGSLG